MSARKTTTSSSLSSSSSHAKLGFSYRGVIVLSYLLIALPKLRGRGILWPSSLYEMFHVPTYTHTTD